MKITKRQLRKIVLEEARKLQEESTVVKATPELLNRIIEEELSKLKNLNKLNESKVIKATPDLLNKIIMQELKKNIKISVQI